MLPITHNCRSIMHRFEFWHTDSCVILTHTYFQSNQDSWQSFIDLAHQRNQISKVWNAKLCLPNHIPVRDTDRFKCHFRQLYFKAKSVGNSLPFYANCYHFLSMLLFSLWLKTWRFLPVYTCKEVLGRKVWWKYYCCGREKLVSMQLKKISHFCQICFL